MTLVGSLCGGGNIYYRKEFLTGNMALDRQFLWRGEHLLQRGEWLRENMAFDWLCLIEKGKFITRWEFFLEKIWHLIGSLCGEGNIYYRAGSFLEEI